MSKQHARVIREEKALEAARRAAAAAHFGAGAVVAGREFQGGTAVKRVDGLVPVAHYRERWLMYHASCFLGWLRGSPPAWDFGSAGALRRHPDRAAH
jgi:hypothetical protein